MMIFASKQKKEERLNTKRIAEAITPKDDAFHGSRRHIAAEWWYFDALFSNDHSIHVGLRTFSKKKYGLFAPFIEFYKDGDLIIEETLRLPMNKVNISKEKPSVLYDNSEIMQLNHNKQNQWEYIVDLQTKTCGCNLSFVGTTPGWKFETPAESWTVALPKAQVKGSIIFDGKQMNVEGMGYHDHNWNYTMVTVMNYGQGWYWGKIASKSFNIVWAKIVKSNKYEILAVVNKDNDTFYNIDPKNINIEVTDFVKVGRFKTPSHFTVRIHEDINGVPLDVDVEMESYGIHYNSVIVAPYFRYHVKSKGYIAFGSDKENVNDQQIMEFLRFS